MSARELPVADAPLLGRAATRALRLRNALTVAVALLLGTAIVLAARGRSAEAAPAAASERTTEIVLDVSGSVGDASYAVMAPTLRRLGHSAGSVGLVLFSDSAEEALPPGSPASLLEPFAAAFKPVGRAVGNPLVFLPSHHEPNPWYPSFSGGTRIAAGLAVAREALRRDGARGTILLISDLGDAPDDRTLLRRELAAVQQAQIPLRIMPLPNALGSDKRWFARLEGTRPFTHSLPPLQAPRAAPISHGVPLALAVAAALLALVLAADQLAGRSLRWGTAR